MVDLLAPVRQSIAMGRYLDTYHSEARSFERGITRGEILYVLNNGWHEKNKDRFDHLHESWCYAVRGKTLDARELRVVVSFEQDNLLIVTAMDLD